MSADRTLQFEREAEANRARLANTLDELSSNLTPGRVLDEVMTYAKGGGQDFLKGLGNAAAANPIPALMIGVGCAMFLSGKGKIGDVTAMFAGNGQKNGHAPAGKTRRDYTEEYLADGLTRREPVRSGKSAVAGIRDAASSVADGIADRASAVGAGVTQTAAQLRDGVVDGATGVRDGLSSAAGTVADAARGAAGAVASQASRVAGTVSAAAGEAGSVVADTGRDALEGIQSLGDSASAYAGELAGQTSKAADEASRMVQDWADRANRFAREQPLIAAAAGLAVGALVAAALPRTKFEDELMGETSDSIKETVGEVATEQFGKAKEAAGQVAEATMTAAKDKGLSPSTASDAVKDLGEKLVDIVTTGREALEDKVLPSKVSPSKV